MHNTDTTVKERSKARVYGRSLPWIVGSNPTCLFASVVCCLRDRPITRPEESYSLWCVVVCDLESSRMRRTSAMRNIRTHSFNTYSVISRIVHATHIFSNLFNAFNISDLI